MALMDWFKKHKFETSLVALLLMILPPLPMVFYAQSGKTSWVWLLLGVIILGNVLAIATD